VVAVTLRTMYDGGMAGLMSLAGKSGLLLVVGEGWTAADTAKFPDATILRLDHTGQHPEYDILDFESRYVTSPSVARKWARQHYKLTGRPGAIYSNPTNYRKLAPSLRGVPWDWWANDQTGQPHAYQPAAGEKTPVATQWFGSRQPTWNHLDRSQTTAGWPPGGSSSSGGGTGGSGGGGGVSSGGGTTVGPGWLRSGAAPSSSTAASTPAAAAASGNLMGVAGAAVLVAAGAFWWFGRKPKTAPRKG